MRILVAALVLTMVGSVASAASIPLPRPRPAAMTPAVPVPAERPSAASDHSSEPAQSPEGQDAASKPADAPKAAEAPPQPSACQLALRAIASFAPEPPVKGNGQCGIADPVRLDAVTMPDQTRVEINPPAVLRCDMAAAVSQWVRTEMAPLVAKLGAPLRGIENFDSYDCRGRNRVFGAKMSEHGRGNALDIKGVKLASGATAFLTDPHVVKTVRTELRNSACERFMTVLGPGSDGYHENHIHVDLAERRNDYKLCQWEVREPLDRVSPSPHIANSRAPTPFESMPSGSAVPTSDAVPARTKQRAAERR